MPAPRKPDPAAQARWLYSSLIGHTAMTRVNMNNIIANPAVIPEAKALAAHIARLTIPLEAALRKRK